MTARLLSAHEGLRVEVCDADVLAALVRMGWEVATS